MKKIISIYTTFPNAEEAETIISKLLEQKLIACANIFPVNSLYTWKGDVQKEAEIVAFLKTQTENWEKVSKMIQKLHSYELPCILKYEIDGSEEYKNWIFENVE